LNYGDFGKNELILKKKHAIVKHAAFMRKRPAFGV